MNTSFTQKSLETLRAVIAEAKGMEVFFLGRTDEEMRVSEVEVLARGHESAVPAILGLCRYGDVVIHNHPSGNLTPSNADLSIASTLGNAGVGFFIVDNAAQKSYRVVEPFAKHARSLLDPAKIGEILGPEGSISKALPGYEERPEQLRMSFAVAEAFNGERLAVIEAGTGTGKSLAYLVPAILWALENEERVLVSTNTINLQEQLIRKDLPFLQRSTGLEFSAVLVKGRGNYLCLRRLESTRNEPGLFDDEHAGEIAAIADWSEKTGDGSKEDLPFIPTESVWEEVRCEIDQCARVRCSRYGSCFFHKARRKAAQADILVVNHALLLSDLSLRHQTENYTATAVLPPFDRVILDEAHHLEDGATRHFSTRVTRFAFARILNRLRHPRKPDKGLLPRLLALLARELPDSADEIYREIHGLIETILADRQALGDRSVLELEAIAETLATSLSRPLTEREELRRRVDADFAASDEWGTIQTRIRDLGRDTASLSATFSNLFKVCGRLPEEVHDKASSLLVDLKGISGRLEGIVSDLNVCASAGEGTCAWIEASMGRIGRGRGIVTRLCTAPLEVSGYLCKGLYDRFRTVVMTSATLAVGGSFDFFRRRTGLDLAAGERLTELLLPSPFDFARQTLVAIPTDVPEPTHRDFPEAVRELTERAILASDGRTFVLFTAYSLLRKIHGELSPILGARGYHCLRQGELNRHILLKRFADDPTSVLFATDSFWEGVDVPGRALEQVIIARLPFRVPTEPVLEARAEAIASNGGDPFMEMTVPEAVLKFKQGFGRLIRHRDDRGVVLILDNRVVKKGYGRIFLRSLPDTRILTAPADAIIAEIAGFFAPPPEEDPPT